MAIVFVEYEGKKIVYDVMDGYQNIVEIDKLLKYCDYYFKRSFSEEMNKMLGCKEELHKMYPLGMNYMVSCENNPYAKKNFRELLLQLRGDKPKAYFTSEKFENPVVYKEKDLQVIFLTRLWPEKEFMDINSARINIIRELKKTYGNQFIGGIRDSEISRKMAPDLLVSKRFTERSNYLKKLKASDICIGTAGLHSSIGWKTAEYVAMGKAIVSEELQYQIPGDFEKGKNYLPFSTEEECVCAVKELMESPEYVYQMKLNNLLYYYQYLKPDIMIKRTLDVIDRAENL